MSKAFLIASFLASASASSSSSSDLSLFNAFKHDFGKTYENKEEEQKRFEIFVENLALIEKRNSRDDTATHGITKFADLTPKEFSDHFTNYSPSSFKGGRGGGKMLTKADFVKKPLDNNDTIVDWTDIYTTPVKNQGYCGSCWAFSAVEQIESDFIRTALAPLSTILSAQQVTSCTQYNDDDGSGSSDAGGSFSYSYAHGGGGGGGGCDGGLTEAAFDYAMDGLELDFYYPYTSGEAGVTGECNADPSKFIVRTVGYVTVSNSSEGEEFMGDYMQSTGPLSVCVDASEWSTYTGGIMSVCGDDVDHCVQAVGVNFEEGYWKVRNSWASDWGEKGFIRLAYGNNTCQIASDAIFSDTLPFDTGFVASPSN